VILISFVHAAHGCPAPWTLLILQDPVSTDVDADVVVGVALTDGNGNPIPNQALDSGITVGDLGIGAAAWQDGNYRTDEFGMAYFVFTGVADGTTDLQVTLGNGVLASQQVAANVGGLTITTNRTRNEISLPPSFGTYLPGDRIMITVKDGSLALENVSFLDPVVDKPAVCTADWAVSPHRTGIAGTIDLVVAAAKHGGVGQAPITLTGFTAEQPQRKVEITVTVMADTWKVVFNPASPIAILPGGSTTNGVSAGNARGTMLGFQELPFDDPPTINAGGATADWGATHGNTRWTGSASMNVHMAAADGSITAKVADADAVGLSGTLIVNKK